MSYVPASLVSAITRAADPKKGGNGLFSPFPYCATGFESASYRIERRFR